MTAKTMTGKVKETAQETAGVLTQVAKSIGSAIGAVAVKTGIVHEHAPRRLHRVRRAKSVSARTKVARATRVRARSARPRMRAAPAKARTSRAKSKRR